MENHSTVYITSRKARGDLLPLELPPVFKEILSAWSELKQTNPKSSKDVQNEILWKKRYSN